MTGTTDLVRLLVRGGSRRDVGTQLLALLAFAVTTCLLLLTLGINLGFAARADRQAWTVPVPATATQTPTAVASTTTDFYDGRAVTVVTLGRLTEAAPVPPGLPGFPGVGQRWSSPALADLVRTDPAALGDRWPGAAAGTIGDRGLTGPDQLLVVVGADPASPVLTAPRIDDQTDPAANTGPVAIVAFADRAGTLVDPLYRDLSLVASVLLVVPLLVLMGAAARLGLARRDQRLAALRLVGASSRQVVAVVAGEAGALALLGAAAGVLPYALALPLASRSGFDGGTWFPSDLWVGGVTLLVVLAAVALGGVLSAVLTLRRVVVSPLGVRRRHAQRSRQLWRVPIFAVALLAYVRLSRSADASATTLVVAFAIVFASLSLLGPAVLALLGRLMIRAAHGPARLIAGRRLTDDPKAAWRTVGGLALTGFVAGFIALFPSSSGQVTWGSAQRIDVAVPVGQVQTDQARAQQALTARGLPGRVQVGSGAGALLGTRIDPGGPGTDTPSTGYLTVTVTPQDQERTRTVLHQALPGLPAATGADVAAQADVFATDLRRASTWVLVASFLVAIASAGITACASVLDRRGTYRQLHLAGTPLRLLDQARRHETTAPVLLLVLGSLGTGLLASAPLTRLGLGGGALDVGGLALLAATVLLGLGGVRLAGAASRPLLRSVAVDTSRG